MDTREKDFVLRFSLSTTIPDSQLDDDDFDENAWLKEWETIVKPSLLRTVFTHLRSFDGWHARVRNRGVSAEDEVEIVLERDPAK